MVKQTQFMLISSCFSVFVINSVFKVNSKDTRTIFTDVILMSLMLTFSNNFPGRNSSLYWYF